MGSFTDPPSGGKGPIRPPLRLVHPAPPPAPKRRHHMGATFTSAEEDRIRAALRGARAAYGSWKLLAAAMRVHPKAPADAAAGRVHISGDIAMRLARAIGRPVETLYAPPSDASTCPRCGARRTP